MLYDGFMVDKLSLCSIPIRLVTVTDAVIATATAFFYRHEEQPWLITNWHNVTGIHPTERIRIDDTSPTSIHLAIPKKEEAATRWKWGRMDLYNQESKPNWLVHPTFREEVDVIAIKVDTDETMGIPIECINDISFDSIKPRVADQVFILGFPHNLKSAGQLPLWKNGTIASEPDADIDGLPMFYVDAATRSGMSGSPVIIRRNGVHGLNDGLPTAETIIGEAQILCGIYSGRIYAKDLLDAQIGIVWKEKIIEEIIIGKKYDTLYYPHESFPIEAT